MSTTVNGIFSSIAHELTQLARRLLGELEAHLNIDDLLPAPTWYVAEVHAGKLWRGSEPQGPTWDHWQELRDRGIRSAVSLQLEEDPEVWEAAPYGIKTLHVPITDNTAPTLAEVLEVLDYMTKSENQPAFIHCRAGKGRTGVMVACYRMAVQGWPVAAAMAEAVRYGMAMDDQKAFVSAFGELLAAGEIPGYPKRPTYNRPG